MRGHSHKTQSHPENINSPISSGIENPLNGQKNCWCTERNPFHSSRKIVSIAKRKTFFNMTKKTSKTIANHSIFMHIKPYKTKESPENEQKT
jgi:hypothetical protein